MRPEQHAGSTAGGLRRMLKVEKVLNASARRLTGAIEPSGGSACEAAEVAAVVGIALKYEAGQHAAGQVWIMGLHARARRQPDPPPLPYLF